MPLLFAGFLIKLIRTLEKGIVGSISVPVNGIYFAICTTVLNPVIDMRFLIVRNGICFYHSEICKAQCTSYWYFPNEI